MSQIKIVIQKTLQQDSPGHSQERFSSSSLSKRSVRWGFPGGFDGEESAYNTGDLGSIPRLGRSPGEENGYPLQYSCLENFMDRGTWPATGHGVTKSQT